MHLAPLIKDLSLILALAATATLIFRRLKLPVVLGYLLAGFIVGPHSASFPQVSDLPNIQAWAEIGVIILMFTLGLEFSFRRLMRLGLPLVITGVVEIFGMLYLGFGVGKLIGWPDTWCLFLGALLSISSTTIIAKSFEELDVKHKKFAEYVFGLLIIEDLVAILFIVVLSTPRPEEGLSGLLIFSTLGKMFLVVGAWFVFGYYFLPRLLKQVAKTGNDESLVIFSLGLCFLLAFVATEFQFSSSLGAFIMGSILSESAESDRVEKLIRPVRDLFLAVFFVSVGMIIEPKALAESWPLVILLSATLIVGKIIFVTTGSLISGLRLRDGIRTGFSLTQIGEFSFIIATLGIQKGSITTEVLSIAISISMITTLLTPAFINLGQTVADELQKRIPQKIEEFMNDYQNWWIRNINTKGEWNFYVSAIAIWILNGLVIVTLFAVSANSLLPYLRGIHWLTQSAGLVSWAITFILSLPFIWGMYWSVNRMKFQHTSDLSFIVLKYFSRIGLLFLVGTLSGAFFEAKLALLVIVITTFVSLVVLYRRLEKAYEDFERRFVGTFKREEVAARPFSGFFPWDAHLSKVVVPVDSPLSGMTLAEADVRRSTGISVVNVRRGSKDIVAPLGSFRVFPEDEMLILGTDEQIQKMMSMITPLPVSEGRETQDFKIRPVAVTAEHSFCGKTIADLRLHENYASLLVGIERDGTRTMSPPAHFQIEAGDYVWLVGPTDRLEQI